MKKRLLFRPLRTVDRETSNRSVIWTMVNPGRFDMIRIWSLVVVLVIECVADGAD